MVFQPNNTDGVIALVLKAGFAMTGLEKMVRCSPHWPYVGRQPF
jgi:hypothetical protein